MDERIMQDSALARMIVSSSRHVNIQLADMPELAGTR